jgi:hypothetical protein
MNHIKEKLEKDLELMKISRSDPNRGEPKGGYKLIQEELARNASSI